LEWKEFKKGEKERPLEVGTVGASQLSKKNADVTGKIQGKTGRWSKVRIHMLVGLRCGLKKKAASGVEMKSRGV